MASSPLGVIKIPVDGAWDIEDLRDLAESLSETYGLFYPLVAADEDTRERLQDLIRKQFWSGDTETRHFGRRLYHAIPEAESLKLKSFRYSSPGLNLKTSKALGLSVPPSLLARADEVIE